MAKGRRSVPLARELLGLGVALLLLLGARRSAAAAVHGLARGGAEVNGVIEEAAEGERALRRRGRRLRGRAPGFARAEVRPEQGVLLRRLRCGAAGVAAPAAAAAAATRVLFGLGLRLVVLVAAFFLLFVSLLFFLGVLILLLGVVVADVVLLLQLVDHLLEHEQRLGNLLHALGVEQQLHPEAPLRVARVGELAAQVLQLRVDLVPLCVDDALLEPGQTHSEF
mmetsp:Transcript_22739/g.70398  ORF Transcript_22739/g.70398 Transcript_22739/m.70398 type:complete len:224 (+) Transcript_22739:655-1326(+)